MRRIVSITIEWVKLPRFRYEHTDAGVSSIAIGEFATCDMRVRFEAPYHGSTRIKWDINDRYGVAVPIEQLESDAVEQGLGSEARAFMRANWGFTAKEFDEAFAVRKVYHQYHRAVAA